MNSRRLMGSLSPRIAPYHIVVGIPRCASQQNWLLIAEMGHVWTAPAVQEESDVSAKRSGAVMYPACFRLEDCLLRDAAAMAAGPDVIR